MRRSLAGVVVAGTAGLALLGGCGLPAGVDGDLVDDWTAVAEAGPFTPAAGTCHTANFAEVVGLSGYEPVDCAIAHRLETAHVGTFTGPPAEQAGPPAVASAPARAAYGECDTKAREYLGDDWRAGRLRLGVALPAEQAWAGGSRWFRCDLIEVSVNDFDGGPVARTATLRGALTGASALRLTCFATRAGSGKQIAELPPVDCGQRHNMEYAGAWRAPGNLGYPSRDGDWAAFRDGCYGVVAGYAGVSKGTVRFRVGVVTIPGGREAWTSGNRGVRCFLWGGDKNFTRSLKGVGDQGLPIQTG